MRSILAIFCIILTSNAFGKIVRDSIGVENDHGKQVILHKVTSRETYYSIGRFYNVSPKTIMEANKIKVLQPGITLRVPTERVYQDTAPAAYEANSQQPSDDLIDYKVGAKETLFAIAKRFNTTVDEIKRINNLKNNSLSVGQIIKVRHGVAPLTPAIPVPVSPVIKSEDPDSANQENRIHPNRYGLTEREEQGIAVWIDDENLDSSKMLALHRTAPIGTVIKITNPMTGKSTFAKVVGKYTENETTRDVIIVITKATADLLGALDKRFRVNIDYGMPNE